MGKTYIADKETLDKCYAILSADGIYGFIEHMDVLSPTARIDRTEQRLHSDFTQQGHRNNDTQQLGRLPDHRGK